MPILLNNMWRENLTPDEINEFKQWARDNFTVGEPINNLWHDVVIEECELMKMEDRVVRALARTWEVIGMDFLDLIAEYDNKSYADKDDVIEAVTDADRLHYQGDDEEAAKYFYSLQYGSPERQRLLDKAFTEDRYGM